MKLGASWNEPITSDILELVSCSVCMHTHSPGWQGRALPVVYLYMYIISMIYGTTCEELHVHVHIKIHDMYVHI